MLKWAVMPKSKFVRRSLASLETNVKQEPATERKASKPKRRHSSHQTRRTLNLPSFEHDDENKENRFTASTPIKAAAYQIDDVLRDVSNVAKSDGRGKKTRKSTAGLASCKAKKQKKRCVDATGHKINVSDNKHNYFRPFETVDSHIGGLLFENDECKCEYDPAPIKRRRVQEVYAPTLPTYDIEYSPFLYACNASQTPLGKMLALNANNKKQKIDHVNDFLQRITFLSSPEDGKKVNVEMESKSTLKHESPLVKQFVDLSFSQIRNESSAFGCNKTASSSLIDDLSLDQLVDAILDSSDEQLNNNNNRRVCKPEEENDLNATQEDNLINAQKDQTISSSFKSLNDCHQLQANFQCECTNKKTINESFNERCVDLGDQQARKRSLSLDDPFESATINCHQLQANFQCKCTNNRTIINVNGPFNERCVDVDQQILRKRSLEDHQIDDRVSFPLKRQRCIRKRRIVDDTKDKSIGLDNPEKSFIDHHDDESDQSLGLEKIINNTDESTPVKTEHQNVRSRRCLLFDLPSFDTISNCSNYNDRGSMELRAFVQNMELYVNVIRCKDLSSTNGSLVNAYVKVILSDSQEDNPNRKRSSNLKRTSVQANSIRPYFNQTFRFLLDTLDTQIAIEVWHRHRSTRTSEFLGCLSFDVKDASEREINGSYHLLPPIKHNKNQTLIQPMVERAPKTENMYESRSSMDEATSPIDDVDTGLKSSTNKTALSEQQKHADENLFLRYLELDPVEGPDAIPAATQRKATGNKNGRTPFTTTRRLARPPRAGFGFSVVWTHPPRIERVEKGLPADKAGILPGDYIIFVDKHNVVMMPEIEILNLIKSYGSQLTLEVFRRNATRNGSVPSVNRLNSTGTVSTAGLPLSTNLVPQRRPSTVCSTNATSMEYNRKKLNLPQVTFSAEKSGNNPEENRRKVMSQLMHNEQQYARNMQFSLTRYVAGLEERHDLITSAEHKILFQNLDELLRITEDIIENVMHDDCEPHVNNFLATYHSKLNEFVSAYRRYFVGIKKADCVLANKLKNSNSEFVQFLQTPSIPKRRPDLTTFIHQPLEHFREVLRLLTIFQSYTKSNQDEFSVINQIVHDLQSRYREITAEAGLMEPVGEGRPLLSVQDLENRLVFTKCKPFVLNKPGRHWIFGGDLAKIEGRNVRQYWALLFSDLLIFAKVSRDRVLFIMEDPLPLAHISEMFFYVRKKEAEFKLVINPGGKNAISPTVHCGPDLSRTPRKNASKKSVLTLRAPSIELKAVWQNLLQRQIFHINAAMEGSSFSSPLESQSPDAPITSSVATLQSAESLSFRRQTQHNVIETESNERLKRIDSLIEHKCKELSKISNNSKGNAIHLEKWMKNQLNYNVHVFDDTPTEEWTEEQVRKRSQELHLIDLHGNIKSNIDLKAVAASDEINEANLLDLDESPSKSTTTDSQITVRSSPIVPETVSVCRQCHKNCLTSQNKTTNINLHNPSFISNGNIDPNENTDEDDDWRPFLLMGLSAINPAACLLKLDPFAKCVPEISVAPPTPDLLKDRRINANLCNCHSAKPTTLELASEEDMTPDDSPQTEEHPYHSLSSSNVTLRRYGTVSSLERMGDESKENEESSDDSNEDFDEETGIDNEAFYQSSIKNWTARAGSFVAEKMAYFSYRDDYKREGGFIERYLTSNQNHVNDDDLQDEETSGATSGEEIWGTPTSGGELDDALGSPNYDDKHSPYNGSQGSDNGDDTELMMDELLMTPPISGVILRGLLPRRTLEPLIEEDLDGSESSPTSSETPTAPSLSPEQGNVTGDVADTCSIAAEKQATSNMSKIHRSESYRRIVEAAEDESNVEREIEALGFFNRFRPSVKFINIERVPRTKGVKIFEFFNVRRERRIHQTISVDSQLYKVFNKDGAVADSVPTAFSEKSLSPRRLKDKQLDRRFWKQLSRRRGTKPSNSQS